MLQRLRAVRKPHRRPAHRRPPQDVLRRRDVRVRSSSDSADGFSVGWLKKVDEKGAISEDARAQVRVPDGSKSGKYYCGIYEARPADCAAFTPIGCEDVDSSLNRRGDYKVGRPFEPNRKRAARSGRMPKDGPRAVRRDHHRRRPQRPGDGLLPGAGEVEGAGARAPLHRRRRLRHRGEPFPASRSPPRPTSIASSAPRSFATCASRTTASRCWSAIRRRSRRFSDGRS